MESSHDQSTSNFDLVLNIEQNIERLVISWLWVFLEN